MNELCFHFKNGLCYFFLNDPYKCYGLCPNFISFDKEFIHRVNKRLKQEHKVKDAIDKYSLDLAFSYQVKSNNNIQDTL